MAEPHTPAVLREQNVQAYLESRFGGEVRLTSLSGIGQPASSGALKGYGYGVPVKVEYELRGRRCAAVLETITPGPFGHEHMADRAQILLWSPLRLQYAARHVHSLDVGGFQRDGGLVSLGHVEEFFILNDYVSGDGYYLEGIASRPATRHPQL